MQRRVAPTVVTPGPAGAVTFTVDPGTRVTNLISGHIVRERVSFDENALPEASKAQTICKDLLKSNDHRLVARDVPTQPAHNVAETAQSTHSGWYARDQRPPPLRYDYQVPRPGTVVTAFQEAAASLVDKVAAVVEPHYTTKLGLGPAQSRALCFSLPRCRDQEFHSDNFDAGSAYYTVLVPLTTAADSGGTRFEKFEKYGVRDRVDYPAQRGTAYCFDGEFLHLGLGNNSDEMRVFVALVFHAPGMTDPNVLP